MLPMDKLAPKQKIMKPVMNTNVRNEQRKDHKVLLLSDRHGRGCAERIKNQLPSNFEVWGLVEPGASSNILYKSVLIETSKFTLKDFIVILHGSVDVSKNKVIYGVKNILQFVMNNLHSNIIAISMPYRRDLPMSSYE
jgi:hypothetical protein